MCVGGVAGLAEHTVCVHVGSEAVAASHRAVMAVAQMLIRARV